MIAEGKKRVIIEGVHPEIDGGQFPIKRVVGEQVIVQFRHLQAEYQGSSAPLRM
jgi:hypothetical protein